MVLVLTGKRLVRVSRQRTKADYCRFAQEVALTWATAEVILEVQDNLNTHNASSFYENLPPAQAFALTKRFEFHERAEKRQLAEYGGVGISALARQCLARRIPDIEILESQLNELVKERNDLEIKAKWQFTIENARQKLNRHYEKVSSKD